MRPTTISLSTPTSALVMLAGFMLQATAAAQCPCAASNAPQGNCQTAATPPPTSPVANGAVVYNPWYPGNVIPFFSAYPFVNAPYLVFDKAVPPPIPAPPPPPQVATPASPPCRCVH